MNATWLRRKLFLAKRAFLVKHRLKEMFAEDTWVEKQGV